jgi:TetR/AcrR family transcriptional regulator, cholesterol catabolism regulator
MSGRRLTARGEARRQRLMDAAVLLFSEKGYHATSVADIVRHEQVGKGLFYWYFSSKDELFSEILRQGLAGLRRAQAEAIAGASDPLSRIERGIRATWRYYLGNRELFGLLETAAADEAFAPTLRKSQETVIADAVRHLKDGIVEGHIRDADPDTLAHCMFGVTNHLLRAYMRGRLDPQPVDEVIEAAVAFCLHGLK